MVHLSFKGRSITTKFQFLIIFPLLLNKTLRQLYILMQISKVSQS